MVGKINMMQYANAPLQIQSESDCVQAEQFETFQRDVHKQFENCEYLVTRYAEQMASNSKNITEYCNTIADYVVDEMGHYLILNTYFQNELILLNKEIAILEARERAINNLNWFLRLFKSKREEAANKAQSAVEAHYQSIIESSRFNSQLIKKDVLTNLKK